MGLWQSLKSDSLSVWISSPYIAFCSVPPDFSQTLIFSFHQKIQHRRFQMISIYQIPTILSRILWCTFAMISAVLISKLITLINHSPTAQTITEWAIPRYWAHTFNSITPDCHGSVVTAQGPVAAAMCYQCYQCYQSRSDNQTHFLYGARASSVSFLQNLYFSHIAPSQPKSQVHLPSFTEAVPGARRTLHL